MLVKNSNKYMVVNILKMTLTYNLIPYDVYRSEKGEYREETSPLGCPLLSSPFYKDS